MNEWMTFAIGLVIGAGAWAIKDVLAPDFLDTRRQQRAAQLQREAELRAYEREDEPVRRRIAAVLAVHVNSLRYRLFTGEYSNDEWQHAHDRLKALVERDDGVRALGEHYQPFVDALSDDQDWLNVERDEAARPQITAPTERDVGREVADTNEHIGHAILNLVPLLPELNVDDTNDLERQHDMHSKRPSESVGSRSNKR